MVNDEGARVRDEFAAPDAGVLVGKVLADERKRELDRSEVRQEPVLRGTHFRVRPVVAHPIAVAVAAGEAVLVGGAGEVALPLTGISEHSLIHNVAKVRLIGAGDEFLLHGGQGEQRLAQREGEPRADLEDGCGAQELQP